MKVLVVIVCYRVVELTVDCLRSLDAEMRTISGAKVTVCENGTGGDATERLEKAIAEHGWSDWCELVAIHPNRGFTGGNNHVIRAAMASADPPEYVLLLNADTVVFPGALRALVEFMDSHPKVGIAGSRLESREGQVHVSAFRYPSAISEFERGLRFGIASRLLSRWRVSPPPAANAEAEWVSGACMIIRREVIEAIGPLDEGYFTYFDDVDYCLNARRAGWPSWHVPSSRVVHLEGASTGIASGRPMPKSRRPAYWYQARRRFYLKNYGRLRAALIDVSYITGLALFRLRQVIQRKPDNDPAHFLRDIVRHSVFLAGTRIKDVPNPALATSHEGDASPTPARLQPVTSKEAT